MEWGIGVDVVWIPELVNHFTVVRVESDRWKKPWYATSVDRAPKRYGVIKEKNEYRVVVEVI